MHTLKSRFKSLSASCMGRIQTSVLGPMAGTMSDSASIVPSWPAPVAAASVQKPEAGSLPGVPDTEDSEGGPEGPADNVELG